MKVQRPGAVRQVALDFAVSFIFFATLQRTGWGNGDLGEIVRATRLAISDGASPGRSSVPAVYARISMNSVAGCFLTGLCKVAVWA